MLRYVLNLEFSRIVKHKSYHDVSTAQRQRAWIICYSDPTESFVGTQGGMHPRSLYGVLVERGLSQVVPDRPTNGSLWKSIAEIAQVSSNHDKYV